jgi:glycerate 2-kinase
MRMRPQQLLHQLFQAAVASAHPSHAVPPHLPRKPKGRTVVVGAGKASAAMAQTLEQHWDGPLSGVVVTRYGYALPCRQIRILEAGHPVPDQAGLAASHAILDAVSNLSGDDLVIALISGGGSALLTLPRPPLRLEEKMETNRILLNGGVPIHGINTIRKQLSAIKGGKLALAAAPARVVTLAISDVPGDDAATIASGPTVADHSSAAEALELVERYRLTLPAAVMALLNRAAMAPPAARDDRFDHCTTTIIARPAEGLEAAATVARHAGYRVVLLGDRIEGEARTVAAAHAELARNAPAGTLLLSGGELTVTHSGSGVGGPNTEYALALALALRGRHNIHALACDSDGIDGTTESAGAMVTPDTLKRAQQLGADPAAHLASHNSAPFFKRLGDLVVTGPTFTNINDFRAVLID